MSFIFTESLLLGWQQPLESDKVKQSYTLCKWAAMSCTQCVKRVSKAAWQVKNYSPFKNRLLDYCDVLSAVWTLILTAPIHCRASIGEQVMWCYISPNLLPWTNKLIYILHGLKNIVIYLTSIMRATKQLPSTIMHMKTSRQPLTDIIKPPALCLTFPQLSH